MPFTETSTDHSDHHTIAADCHDKAALQHREAAQLQLVGDQEKADQCTKSAREFGVQAMQHGSKCSKDNAAIAKSANGGSLKGANAAITRSANGGNHRPV
jgi:hypothetical protein